MASSQLPHIRNKAFVCSRSWEVMTLKEETRKYKVQGLCEGAHLPSTLSLSLPS